MKEYCLNEVSFGEAFNSHFNSSVAESLEVWVMSEDDDSEAERIDREHGHSARGSLKKDVGKVHVLSLRPSSPRRF
jgi:hypothetical protein